MVRGSFAFPPDVGARFVTRLETEADAEYRHAHTAGRHEPHHCLVADALARLVRGEGTTRRGVVEGVVHVSHESLRRGSVAPGEVCMIAGFGDIPIEVARELLADAFLKGVVVDGTRVEVVRHFGRRPCAAVRTALEVRAVLQDGAVVCATPGCDRTVGIEWDHIEPHAAGGPTELANMQPLCAPHHRAKTATDQTRTRRRASADTDRVPP